MMEEQILEYGILIGILISCVGLMFYYCLYLYEKRRYLAKRRWLCDSCKKKMDYLRELN